MRRVRQRLSQLIAVTLLGTLVLAGCSKEEIKKAAAKIKDDVAEVVEKAPEVAPPPKKTSQMHVSLGDTDKISAPTCFVALHDFHNDLPSILSVTSYEKPESEQFPAFMIQGEVEVGSLPALINQAVPVELYVMLSRESPVWHSAPGQPVEVRVTAASEAEVTGEIVSGTLINSETGESKSVTGKFEFVR